MNKHLIKENEFAPAVGGTSGTSNYQTGYGTFVSPDASQNPGHFEHSDNNKAVNQNSNTSKATPKGGSQTKDINAIYSKKNTPTPDEIVTGIKYELGQQIKKDKQMAKQEVLTNLKKDPHFYSELHMLNITDKDMMKENKMNKIRDAINQTKNDFDSLKRMDG